MVMVAPLRHLIVISNGMWGVQNHCRQLMEEIERVAKKDDECEDGKGGGSGGGGGGEGKKGNTAVEKEDDNGSNIFSTADTSAGEVLVVIAKSNQLLRTYDGIHVCGKRFADEVREVLEERLQLETCEGLIRQQQSPPPPPPPPPAGAICGSEGGASHAEGAADGRTTNRDIDVSLIGYSAGGLFVRYALGELYRDGFFEPRPYPCTRGKEGDEEAVEGNDSAKAKPTCTTITTTTTPPTTTAAITTTTRTTMLRVHLNRVITIATPHLGSRKSHKRRFGQLFNRLSANAANLYGGRSLEQLVLTDTDGEDGSPLLLAMSRADSWFHRALASARAVYVYANALNDNTVSYCTAAVDRTNRWKRMMTGSIVPKGCIVAVEPVWQSADHQPGKVDGVVKEESILSSCSSCDAANGINMIKNESGTSVHTSTSTKSCNAKGVGDGLNDEDDDEEEVLRKKKEKEKEKEEEELAAESRALIGLTLGAPFIATIVLVHCALVMAPMRALAWGTGSWETVTPTPASPPPPPPPSPLSGKDGRGGDGDKDGKVNGSGERTTGNECADQTAALIAATDGSSSSGNDVGSSITSAKCMNSTSSSSSNASVGVAAGGGGDGIPKTKFPLDHHINDMHHIIRKNLSSPDLHIRRVVVCLAGLHTHATVIVRVPRIHNRGIPVLQHIARNVLLGDDSVPPVQTEMMDAIDNNSSECSLEVIKDGKKDHLTSSDDVTYIAYG